VNVCSVFTAEVNSYYTEWKYTEWIHYAWSVVFGSKRSV